MWFSGGFGSAGLWVGLGLRGLFQPDLWFCGSCDPGRIPGCFGEEALAVLAEAGVRRLEGRVHGPAVFNKIAFCLSHLAALGDV